MTRDPREVIGIYLADALDDIATIHRILAADPRPDGPLVTVALDEASKHLEKARTLLDGTARTEPPIARGES